MNNGQVIGEQMEPFMEKVDETLKNIFSEVEPKYLISYYRNYQKFEEYVEMCRTVAPSITAERIAEDIAIGLMRKTNGGIKGFFEQKEAVIEKRLEEKFKAKMEEEVRKRIVR